MAVAIEEVLELGIRTLMLLLLFRRCRCPGTTTSLTTLRRRSHTTACLMALYLRPDLDSQRFGIPCPASGSEVDTPLPETARLHQLPSMGMRRHSQRSARDWTGGWIIPPSNLETCCLFAFHDIPLLALRFSFIP